MHQGFPELFFLSKGGSISIFFSLVVSTEKCATSLSLPFLIYFRFKSWRNDQFEKVIETKLKPPLKVVFHVFILHSSRNRLKVFFKGSFIFKSVLHDLHLTQFCRAFSWCSSWHLIQMNILQNAILKWMNLKSFSTHFAPSKLVNVIKNWIFTSWRCHKS